MVGIIRRSWVGGDGSPGVAGDANISPVDRSAREVPSEASMNRPNELTRRDFVAAGAAVVAGAAGCRPARPIPPPMGAAELAELSAVDAVAAMAKGEVTAERYAGVLLDRCQQWKSLNAFITLDPERVLQSARAADQARS